MVSRIFEAPILKHFKILLITRPSLCATPPPYPRRKHHTPLSLSTYILLSLQGPFSAGLLQAKSADESPLSLPWALKRVITVQDGPELPQLNLSL